MALAARRRRGRHLLRRRGPAGVLGRLRHRDRRPAAHRAGRAAGQGDVRPAARRVGGAGRPGHRADGAPAAEHALAAAGGVRAAAGRGVRGPALAAGAAAVPGGVRGGAGHAGGRPAPGGPGRAGPGGRGGAQAPAPGRAGARPDGGGHLPHRPAAAGPGPSGAALAHPVRAGGDGLRAAHLRGGHRGAPADDRDHRVRPPPGGVKPEARLFRAAFRDVRTFECFRAGLG
ncbi:hypothetical protein SGPA1_50659 [Streptomyces misionensis JCM 4497]